MRQIHICAWLLVMSATAAACSGEKFTASEQSGAGNAATAEVPRAGTAGSNQSGSSSAGGSGQLGSGGTTSASAGHSSTSGTGGVTASGGTSSAGSPGNTSGSGNTGEACPSGAITFRMLPSPELAKDVLCDAGCGTGWLTITDAQGAMAFSIFSACGTASCETCEMTPCLSAACLPAPLTARGSELVWTGTYLAKDVCGASMACQRQACVKPGKYKAKACAAINGGASPTGSACTPKNEQLCTEAEFDFPATKTVELVLRK